VPKEKVEARQWLLNNSPFSLSFPIRHILHKLHKLYCPVSFLQRNVYVVLTWNRAPMESGTWARPRVGIGHRDPSQPRRKINKALR